MNAATTIVDVESSPLIKEEIEVTESSPAPSLSKTARGAIALLSLIALSAVAFTSYAHAQGAFSGRSNLQLNGASTIYAEDVAVCANTYVEDVTPRTAVDGCVVFSKDNVYSTFKHAESTKTVCISSSGPSAGRVDINYDQLVSLGLIDKATGKSVLSGINPGANVDVKLYQGPQFDGDSVIVDSGIVDGGLPSKLFLDGTGTNDNVYSLSIISQTSFFFAGPQCGQDTQICAGVISAEDAVKEQPKGCILFADTDPTAPGKELGHTRAARFCTTKHAAPFNSGVVVVPKTSLQALGLANADYYRKGKSDISYIKRNGATTTLDYYTNADGTGIHHSHTGRLGLWNDAINSFTFSSLVGTLPTDCGPFGFSI